MDRARLVGINHVALEVGDLEAALRFYGRLFSFSLRGRVPGMAFLDLGDQFLALQEVRQPPGDAGGRHFGLVVDSLDAARAALRAGGVAEVAGRGLSFRDPWGNLVELVDYRAIQFTKAPAVLDGMGLGDLQKGAAALEELRAKGLGAR
jgi:catechol 2,3-dioxygenase-like lactoylglutathione lyase family enzyme